MCHVQSNVTNSKRANFGSILFKPSVLKLLCINCSWHVDQCIKLMCLLVSDILVVRNKYSLQDGKRSRFGQRYGLQSITLTSYFYKNIYWKVIYVYFYESIFSRQIYSCGFHIFKLNNLLWCIFLMFDSNLVQNNFLYKPRGSMVKLVLIVAHTQS
jgi:hypothetical protein